jgi:hypothetical protein
VADPIRREEIDRLRELVARLEEQVGSLQAQLDALTARGLCMRAQCRCPACGCRKILHSTEVPDADSAGGYSKAAAATRKRWYGKRPQGALHLYICTGCGLAEWHVPDLSEVEVDGETLRLLDGEAPEGAGPYR